MGKLHCILESHVGSPRVINATEMPLSRSFSRPVADWLGPRYRTPFRLEEYFSTESLPFLFDADYQDSKALDPDASSHFDWDFETGDSDLNDLESATAFWDDFFYDLETISRQQAEQVHPLDQALMLDGGEIDDFFSYKLSHPRVAGEIFRSLVLGSVFHLAALSLFIAAPTQSLSGLGGISDKPMFVRLTETCEINTPNDPSPASIDAPASMASLARRGPKPEEKKEEKPEKKEFTELEAKQTAPEPQVDSRRIELKSADKFDLPHQKILSEHFLEHSPFNDSKSLQDSLSSTPSVATPERKGSLKAGDEVQTYKDQVLSAIHDAAYYPRAALKHMAHGKAVVRFTIKKDGSLAEVAIVVHAESGILDAAALKIVEKASSHFPPFPDALMKEQVSYVVPIVFKKGL